MEVWSATKQENGHWLFEWTADSGDPFDIWLNGELLASISGGSYEAELDGYDTSPPPLEIVADDSVSVAESPLYPPFAVLQWRGVSTAEAYQVERLVGGNWLVVKSIMEVGAGYYLYQTPLLTEGVSSSFRVSASDALGNTGTAITFTFSVTRNPAPPDVSISVAAGVITVAS